jgi:hypothetical protein
MLGVGAATGPEEIMSKKLVAPEVAAGAAEDCVAVRKAGVATGAPADWKSSNSSETGGNRKIGKPALHRLTVSSRGKETTDRLG